MQGSTAAKHGRHRMPIHVNRLSICTAFQHGGANRVTQFHTTTPQLCVACDAVVGAIVVSDDCAPQSVCVRCAFVCGLRLYQPLGALPAVRAAAVHSMLHDETSVVSAWVWWRGRLWMNKRGPLFILITLPHTNHHSLVIVFMFELAMLSYAMSLFCCCYGYCLHM